MQSKLGYGTGRSAFVVSAFFIAYYLRESPGLSHCLYHFVLLYNYLRLSPGRIGSTDLDPNRLGRGIPGACARHSIEGLYSHAV